jgi:hypothetical protein
MSIPLDRLYHFIEDLAQSIYQERVIIYRFYPHGSKNIEDMEILEPDSWQNIVLSPSLYCNDQEPLDYTYYNTIKRKLRPPTFTRLPHFLNNRTVYEKVLLLHSEQQSANVKQYSQDYFIPVYWWSHATLSLDWFRYAQHIRLNKQHKKTFLIYNRAWSGTREYRLRFCELLIQFNLQDHCQTSIQPVEPELGIHYDFHQFDNPAWRPKTVLEDHVPVNRTPSHYSADFDVNDYNATDIEIVLETLFDDDRLHLTEKSLRPIALGQPFVLAATAGSLGYLRSYGFETFDSVWDESYDNITHPEQRLYAITDLMRQIANWGPHERATKLAKAQAIADRNRLYFFSDKFFYQVVGELTTNLTVALAEVEHTKNYRAWIDRWNTYLQDPDIFNHVSNQVDLICPNLPAINHIKALIDSKLDAT